MEHKSAFLPSTLKSPSSQPPRDGYDPPEIDLSHDVALVTRLLNRSIRCNGVCSEKILLWGPPGCGKRRIATRAALEFSASTGCKVLWIEGRSFETFVRDFRDAYTTVTGESLPQGLSIVSLLLKIMFTLGERRQEWLMVIFDLQYYLELEDGGGTSSSSSSRSAPISFLPESSRVIVTSSYIVAAPFNRDLDTTCGLKFARDATCLHVTGFDQSQVVQYLKAAAVESHDLDVAALRDKASSAINPLRLVLSCATMRFLRVSARQLQRLCLHIARKGRDLFWLDSPSIIFDTMPILWKALNDYDTAAVRLLAMCCIVDRLDLPIILLRRFPFFQEDDGETLSSAINILRLCGLVEVRHKYGHDTINLHLLIYRWVQIKLRVTEDEQEYIGLVHSWSAIFLDYFTTPAADAGLDNEGSIISAAKFWPMVAHVVALCDQKTTKMSALSSLDYVVFLKHVAILLVEDGILINLAGVVINFASDMCRFLQSRGDHDLKLDRETVHVRQVRSLALLKMSDFRRAEGELREAKHILLHRLADDIDSKHRLRQIEDAEAHLNIIQGKYPEAGRMIGALLASPEPCADPFKIAQRHYWMSIYKTAVEADLSALKHSHMTMSYWRSLPPEERWGSTDSRRLHWVEKHIVTLMCMRKYRGALLLGSKFLDRAHQLTPVLCPSICRLTFRVVICSCALDKVSEAEKAVCQLLELSKFGKMEDETFSYLLHMLHELGIALQRNGRTVEAEAVYRFNLRMAKRFEVKNLAGTERYDHNGDWVQLVMCLLEQGKRLEARRLRDQYQSELVTEEFMNKLTQESMKAYRNLKDVYAQTIEAEASGTILEWKAILYQNGGRSVLKRGLKMFGDPKQRIEEDRHFESDIDIYNIRRARRSRLLHLLNFPLIYLSFVDTSEDVLVFEESEELWASLQQTVLGQYWKWCDCKRKRRRSQSISPADLIAKSFILKCDPDPALACKVWRQKLITDWIIRTPQANEVMAEGCHSACPCIDANKAGQGESTLLESCLFLWKDPAEDLSSKPEERPRYRNAIPDRSPIPENEVFILVPPNHTWWWAQSEFTNGENEGENYIIPRALDIPGISITPPDGQTHLLPLATEPQDKMTKFYERDYATAFQRATEKQWEQVFYPTRLDDILEDDEHVDEDEKYDGFTM